ncbi:OmpA family protein [Halosquirtibacter laminarini]|uniref:OmpA family protein n=1 Tax=Halosquirtibacter laminarini TaxID=3374600 RepID=A0AC61NEF9_9BACT|nr:OmpA family protein [Prolixibacteraceae bacterium]
MAQPAEVERYVKKGKIDKAIAITEKYCSDEKNLTDTERAICQYKLALYHQYLHHDQEYEKHLKEAVSISPDYWEYTKAYGDQLYQKRAYHEALELFRDFYKRTHSDTSKRWIEYTQIILQEIERTKDKIDIFNYSELNTPQSEIAPQFVQNHILFASNKDETDLRNMEYMVDIMPVYHTFLIDNKTDEIKRSNINVRNKYHCIPNHYAQETLWFTKTSLNREKEFIKRTKKRRLSIYKVTKNDEGRFINPTEVILPKFENRSIGNPTLNSTQDILVFVSEQKDDPNMSDLYISKKRDGKWGVPIIFGKNINTNMNESFPHIISDSLLVFSSNGRCSFGGYDLYYTHLIKPDKIGVHHFPLHINSSYDDIGMDYIREYKKGVISSNRPGGKGQDDIYRFNANLFDYFVYHILIREKGTDKPIKDCHLLYIDKDSTIISRDKKGQVDLRNIEKREIQLRVHAEGYLDTTVNAKEVNLLHGDIYNRIYLKRKKREETYQAEQVYFGFDSTLLQQKEVRNLQKIAKTLRESPNKTAYISGHTDSCGSKRYNITLSERRAMMVEKFLLNHGVSRSQLIMKYFGEDIPNRKKVKMKKDTKNRRVEIYIATNLDSRLPQYVQDDKIFSTYQKHFIEATNHKFKWRKNSTKENIYFRFNSIRLGTKDKEKLDLLIRYLKAHPMVKVKVEGHTDIKGSEAYNEELSVNRAKVVGTYLQRVLTNPITIKGYGERSPSIESACSSTPYLKDQYNRRVIIRF